MVSPITRPDGHGSRPRQACAQADRRGGSRHQHACASTRLIPQVVQRRLQVGLQVGRRQALLRRHRLDQATVAAGEGVRRLCRLHVAPPVLQAGGVEGANVGADWLREGERGIYSTWPPQYCRHREEELGSGRGTGMKEGFNHRNTHATTKSQAAQNNAPFCKAAALPTPTATPRHTPHLGQPGLWQLLRRHPQRGVQLGAAGAGGQPLTVGPNGIQQLAQRRQRLCLAVHRLGQPLLLQVLLLQAVPEGEGARRQRVQRSFGVLQRRFGQACREIGRGVQWC